MNKPFKGKDRRKNPKVGSYHVPKGGQRYQFRNLIVKFDAKFNIWYVIDSTKPGWKNVLHEIIGIENEKNAIDWALAYLNGKKQKHK